MLAVRRHLSTQAMAEGIAGALGEACARVQAASSARGTPGREVRLVAVSKTKPPADIMQAYGAGQRHFGENYIDELVEKAPQLPSDIQWHFIGHLQSNKANLLASIPNLSMWETCSSIKTARLVNKALVTKQPTKDRLSVLVQVNSSSEENKHGVEPSACAELVRFIQTECPRLRFSGLMTIGMFGRDPNDKPNPDFKLLVDTRSALCQELGLNPEDLELSMGMSDDFEHAIELGSTNVRVGSTIFGARAKKN
eukprot:comp23424_c0_seq1/m.38968 comp23424_c0_seq1/g.38968  ORF comp23424_c0_seq1/g.38968 comp23424_c0_seq1/m.38968 type:complete len:253 (-) comp23424_c0_seq1:223-981(-)